MKSRILIIALLIGLITAGSALAYAPTIGVENDGVDNSYEIKDTAKSVVIYDEIGELHVVKYYRFHMISGQRLKVSLFTPDKGLNPTLVLMGLGLPTNYTLPDYVEVPLDCGVVIYEGTQQEYRKYEPLAPSSYYHTLELDIQVNTTGTYYIALFDHHSTGKVGITFGYEEEFSIFNWIFLPLDSIDIFIWEGKNILYILAPLYLTVFIGIGVLLWRSTKGLRLPANFNGWLGIIGALFYIGTGAMVVTNMIFAILASSFDLTILITLIFCILPLVLGALMLVVAIGIHEELKPKTRAKLFGLGIAGIFLISGLFIGPILSIIGSLIPFKDLTRAIGGLKNTSLFFTKSPHRYRK